MAAISKKFKHGDIILFDEFGTNDFGKVLIASETVHPKWSKQIKEIIEYSSSIPNTIVIALWRDGGIRWCEENLCRLATNAEKVLYGQKT